MDIKAVFLQFLFFECCNARNLSPNFGTEYVEIEISELTSSGPIKRSVDLFPSDMTVVLKTKTEDITLNLTMVKEILNTPTLITLTEEGLHIENNLNNNSQKALYKEKNSLSAFTIHRKEDMSIDVHGTFVRDEELYFLQPKPQSNNDTSHQLSKVDGEDLEYTRDYMTINGLRNQYTNRHRRSTGHRLQDNRKMDIEYVVVTDYKLYQKWHKDTNPVLSAENRDLWTKYLMMEFYHHVINGMDMIFKSSHTQGLELNVVLAGLVVANTSRTSVWTENHLTCPDCNTVDDQNTLLEFAKWRRASLLPRLNHDHATLFTGYDLYYKDRDSKKTVGLSYLSKMCSNWSVAVVEDHRNALTSHVAAHELGHSLGAGHDGRPGIKCTENDKYLMAPKMTRVTDPAKAHNPWSFSQCSVNDMLGFISKLDRNNMNCLLNAHADVPSPFKKIAGQTYSADDQCKFSFGESSSVCREQHYHDWTAICYGLSCRNPDTQRCQMILPHDGTSCGNKKWCRQGMCVHGDDAAAANETCPMGDDSSANCTTANCTLWNIHYGTCCETCQRINNKYTATPRNDADTPTIHTSTDNAISTTHSTQDLLESETTMNVQFGDRFVHNMPIVTSTTQQKRQHTTPEGLLIFTVGSKKVSTVQPSSATTSFKQKSKIMEHTTRNPNMDGASIESGFKTKAKTNHPAFTSTKLTSPAVNKIHTTGVQVTREMTTNENRKIDEKKLNYTRHTTSQSEPEQTAPPGLLIFTLKTTKRATEDTATTMSEPLDIPVSSKKTTVPNSSTINSSATAMTSTLDSTTTDVEDIKSVAAKSETTTHPTSNNIKTSTAALRTSLFSVNVKEFCKSKPVGFYADINDCNSYFLCYNGGATSSVCPAGLAWNHKDNICDWPPNVDCSRSEDSVTTTTNSIASTTPVSSSTATTPIQQASTITSTTGSSPSIGSTSTVTSSSTSRAPETTTDTYQIPSTFCVNKASGNHPHPGDCSKYITCIGISQYIRSCPSVLRWNHDKGNCDWEHNVVCNV